MSLKNKIIREYQRFLSKQFKKWCINIDESIFNPGNSSLWRQFHYNNTDTIKESLENLKKNLDTESQLLLEKVYENFVYVFPEAEYSQHCLFNSDKIFACNQNLISPNDGGIKYLPDNIIKKLKNTDFIDGGAFDGDSAKVFCKYSPNNIYSFEPNPDNYSLLQKNIKTCNLKNVIPINKGLGEKPETAAICGEMAYSSLQTTNAPSNNTFQIQITTIDTFVEENNLKPGLIKLDIEGFELEAIKGAVNTIKTHKPVLLISIYHHPKDFFFIKPLIEELNLGYTFIVRKLLDSHPVIDTMLIGYTE